jgi:hypothetical protein
VSALGLDKYVGQVITGLDGSKLRVTRAGIIAAGHRVGVPALLASLSRIADGKKPTNIDNQKTDNFVKKRLREFENVTYGPHH